MAERFELEQQKIEKILIDLIRKNPKITRKEMCLAIKKSKSTLDRILKKSNKISNKKCQVQILTAQLALIFPTFQGGLFLNNR